MHIPYIVAYRPPVPYRRNGLCVVYVRHLITHLGILLYCVTMDARYYVEVNALKSKGTGIQILSTVSENDVHIA